MSTPPGSEDGERFGPYRVLGVLGNGGMGRVLRAHDAEHQRDVALKVLHAQWAQDESYRGRFRREAQIACQLNEPHVIPIHRYGEIDGQLFLDMRLVEGEDLDSLLKRGGPMDPARAADLVGQVARALDAAHAKALVHRDVKPSNVLLVARSDGGDLAASAAGEDFAYLADFGIARGADDGAGPALTATGTAIGSTEYMAPERFGSAAADARSDVYSLACVLFELLTGRRPFAAGDPMALMYAHLHEPPPRPSSLRPGIPPELDEVVLRGLAKDPAQRWQTAGQLATAARAALAASGVPVPRADDSPTMVGAPSPPGSDGGRAATRQEQPFGPVPAPPTTLGRPAVAPSTALPGAAPAPPSPPARRGVLPWALAGIALVLAAALAGWALVLDGRADDAAESADAAAERLLAFALPEGADQADCTEEAPADQELRRVTCPATDGDDAAPAGSYTVFAGNAAAEAFAATVEERDLRELEDVFDCGTGDTPQGWAQITDSDDQPVGRVACSVDAAGDAQLHWVWDDLGTLAMVEQRGGGEDGLSGLRSWWGSAADRGY
jgi:hypothetical protein